MLQLKFTTASVRTSVAGVLNVIFVNAMLVVFVQYWPSNPTPLPRAAVLTKDADATPLLTAPDFTAIACTLNVVVTVNGPV